MHKIVLVLSCLVYEGQGWRARTSFEQSQSISSTEWQKLRILGSTNVVPDVFSPLIVFSKLLLFFTQPLVAFKPSGHVMQRASHPMVLERVSHMSDNARGLTDMDQFDIDAFVKEAVPDCTSISVQKEQLMGFSGARVAELNLQTSSGPRNVFLKIVVPPLNATDTAKLQRNVQSYANEFSFLSDARFAQALDERGASIPKTFKVEVLLGKRFIALQECLTEEYMLLAVHPAARTPEVLRWLAALHSTFFGKVPSDLGLEKAGTHVHLFKRIAAESELSALPGNVQGFCEAFSEEHPFFGQPEVAELGSRLQAVAQAVAEHLWPGDHNLKHTTLVHGDFKGANYFLKREGQGVVGFDWQWTGPGIGATDLIFLFCTGVEDSIVDDYMSALRLYHGALDLDGKTYSFDEFLTDFKVATLDYARWAFSVRLGGDTPAKFRQRAENVDVNLGYFRRHPPRVQWLLQLVLDFLPEAESGQLFFRQVNDSRM